MHTLVRMAPVSRFPAADAQAPAWVVSPHHHPEAGPHGSLMGPILC